MFNFKIKNISNIKKSGSWQANLLIYLEATSLRMFMLGFSAGLPFLLVFGTLSFRLREAGLDLSMIGYLSWIGLTYSVKWIWSPLIDRMPIPFVTSYLGRRRSWLLVSQILITCGLLGMAFFHPQNALTPLIACTLLVAFSSATQDIALDAFRIESASIQKQAALTASYLGGYRLSMIWAGAGALWIAARAEIPNVQLLYQPEAWQMAYSVMACSMIPGMLTVLFSTEPAHQPLSNINNIKQWIAQTVIAPFRDFFARYQWEALLILMLISIYRISDIVMGIMTNPFYSDMGYSKDEIAAVTKIYGVIMTLVGAYIGGALTIRFGIMRMLLIGALLSASTNLLFAWLSTRGHDLTGLIAVIAADNLAAGISTVAFLAYLSSLTNRSYTATQYALFSSIMTLFPKSLAGFSGRYAENFGYSQFFITTACLGIPVIFLIFWMIKNQKK